MKRQGTCAAARDESGSSVMPHINAALTVVARTQRAASRGRRVVGDSLFDAGAPTLLD